MMKEGGLSDAITHTRQPTHPPQKRGGGRMLHSLAVLVSIEGCCDIKLSSIESDSSVGVSIAMPGGGGGTDPLNPFAIYHLS